MHRELLPHWFISPLLFLIGFHISATLENFTCLYMYRNPHQNHQCSNTIPQAKDAWHWTLLLNFKAEFIYLLVLWKNYFSKSDICYLVKACTTLIGILNHVPFLFLCSTNIYQFKDIISLKEYLLFPIHFTLSYSKNPNKEVVRWLQLFWEEGSNMGSLNQCASNFILLFF